MLEHDPVILEKAVSKLYTLKDSCRAIEKANGFKPGLTWFEGAAEILAKALSEIEKAMLDLDKLPIDEPQKETPTDQATSQ